jgi:hypothetical protein
MPNASSRKRNGNGRGLNAAFRIGQTSLLTSNTNGRALFSHLFGPKKIRSGKRGAAAKARGLRQLKSSSGGLKISSN